MRILIACPNSQEAEEVVAEAHRLAPDWQVSTCSSTGALERLLGQQSYEVVVCDLELFRGGSLEDLRPVTELAPDSHLIVLVDAANQLLGARALAAGADYHLLKYDRWPNELLLVARQAQAVLDQRRELRQMGQFSRQIIELAGTIATHGELEPRLELVAQAALSISDASHCWIEVLDSEGSEFEHHYSYGSGAALADAWQAQVRDVAWRAAHYGELLIDQLTDGEGSSYRAVALPVAVGNSSLGAVVVALRRSEALSSLQRQALQFLAGLAGLVVENGRLNRLALQRTQQMEAAATQAWEEEARARTLLAAAVAVTDSREAGEVLDRITTNAAVEIGFDRVAVYLADYGHNALQGALQASSDGTVSDISDRNVSLRSGDNPLADAALGDEPYMLLAAGGDQPNTLYQEQAYPCLLVPLRTHGNLVGVIVADRGDSGTAISAQQIRLLRSMAGMASVALERIRVDKLRELFVSSISHELRTPLASLQASNELVLDEEVGPLNDEQRQYLSRVASACQQLRRILDDLTDWSYLQAGRVSVRKHPVDLRSPIKQVAETLRPQADQRGVEILLNLPGDSLEVFTDPRRLEQVVMNLVDNAIKFNYTGGQVEVSVEEEKGTAVIKVADTGPGIPAGLEDSIFEAFDRGSTEISRAVEGVGLGLAIALHITRLLGGELSVASQPGQGSTFTVRLPLEASSK